MATKYRSSPATKPEEQTTPQASPFSIRRFWSPAKPQTGSVPTSKKARYSACEAPATTPQQGTPCAQTLIASVSSASAAPRVNTSVQKQAGRTTTAGTDPASDLTPTRRNLSQDFEATAAHGNASTRGAKLFGIFSPVFSIFMGASRMQSPSALPHHMQQEVQYEVAAAAATTQEHAPEQQGQSQAEVTVPAAPATQAQPARRNSNVVAMEDGVAEEESDGEDSPEEGSIDWDDESNPYAFIRRLPYLPRVAPTTSCAIAPKLPNAPKPTLVLDLDETLVHCNTEFVPGVDVVFPVVWNGIEYRVYARKRPGLDQFMEEVTKMFEVVVFTASQQVYADKLLDIIDPQGRWFKHRVFRDGCVCVEGNYLKDLSILGRDLSRTVIIDNSPQAFGFQYNNGIPILSWFDSPEDNELIKLLPLLRTLSSAPDVRQVLRSHFKLYKRIERRF